MNIRLLIVVTAMVGTFFLPGCVTAPERSLSRELPPYVALPNGNDPLNPDQPVPRWKQLHANVEGGVIRYFERKRGHALNILELSGGGQNGAFGAGFLKGWTDTGRRPQFDIVTGISTGSLMATHAFLGTPADDAVLEQIYTRVNRDDIYRSSGALWRLLTGRNALADTSPLKALIDKYITPSVLQRVAAAYDDNRRLWVGSTNLDYKQTWVWNLTRIAKQGGPDALETYRKVVLASASFPVAFPPVEIAGDLIADGAVRANVLVIGLTGGTERPKPPLYGPGNVYVIYNGKISEPPQAVRNDFQGIADSSFALIMNSSMETVLIRSFFGAVTHGYHFNLVAIPDDVDTGTNPLAFDTKQMRAAFDAGYAMAKQPNPWAHAPPDLGDYPPWALKALQKGR